METVGGRFELANSSVPCKHDEVVPSVMTGGKGASVAGCSSELLGVVAQSSALDAVLPEMVFHGVEEQAMDDLVLSEAASPASTFESNKSSGGNSVPLGPSSSTLLDEYLGSFNCTAPLSLLDAPIIVHLEGDSTCALRHSGRLEKKNKNCNIPTAKLAEFRLAEAFGELTHPQRKALRRRCKRK